MEELTRLVQKVADRTLYSVNKINRKGIDHTQKVKWSSNSEPAKAKHVYKRMRSWADDLVLVSTTPRGLQTCLNRLHDYCYKWAISINPSKTVCMIMSKWKCKSRPKFYIDGQELSQTNKVTYLGLVITSNMNHSIMMEDRIQKANRATYLLRQAISCNGYIINIKLAIKLFDKIISPILLYGCCVWGIPKTTNYVYVNGIAEGAITRSVVSDIFKLYLDKHVDINLSKRVGKKNNTQYQSRPIMVELKHMEDKFKLLYSPNNHDNNISVTNFDIDFESTSYEKMHSKFLKNILNVSKYCRNSAIRGELGRLPLSIKVLSLGVKYWHFMNTQSCNVLLKCALQSELGRQSTWVQSIGYLLKTSGLGYIWEDLYCVSTKYLYQLFKRRLSDQYLQKWFMNNPYTAIGLKELKSQYVFSEYLSLVQSPNIRSILAKLRVNTNVLKTSGYQNKGEVNVCPLCDNSLEETVMHFILHCPKYTIIRNIFLTKLKDLIRNYNLLTEQEILCIILNLDINILKDKSQIDIFINLVLSYIKAIYSIRTEHN